MQAGARGACVRCGEAEPVRGIVSGPEPRVATPEATMAGFRNEVRFVEHRVEDAFDPGPSAYLTREDYEASLLPRRMTKDELFRKLDNMLGRRTLDVMPPAPVSDYVAQMAAEFYDDAA